MILTNFHSLGNGEDPDDLLAKLEPDDIDFIVIDEAHIAAAESYQRLFRHFSGARTLLMSACFQRMDGKPIDADVVYRYRLIDSIADGNAKNLRVERFAPESAETIYEIDWPDGAARRDRRPRRHPRDHRQRAQACQHHRQVDRTHPSDHARREGRAGPTRPSSSSPSSRECFSQPSASDTPSRSPPSPKSTVSRAPICTTR